MDHAPIRRAWIAIVVALITLAASFTFADSAVAKRMALVVANVDYLHTPVLANPAHDTDLIVRKLEQLEFKVEHKKNLDAKQFLKAIEDFSSSLDKESEALLYYAGHGLQYKEQNYLVGVDATLKSEAALPFETFRLDSILNQLEAHAGTSIVFWDACRNNPLADELLRSISTITPNPLLVVRGGAAPQPQRRGNTLIVFSAEPGKFALDGRGELSPFAEALGKHIATPDVEIEVMLKRVTEDVITSTKNYQLPQRLSQLTREFYFNRQSSAERAYKEESARIAAKVEQLNQRPSPIKHFSIIGTHQVAVSPSSQRTPTRDAGQNDFRQPNVMVAVNFLESTVIRKVRIAADGQLLALGGDDGVIRIVNVDTFEVVRTIHAHKDRISDLDFSPDGKILLSAGRDGYVRFWRTATGAVAREQLSVAGSVPYSAKFNATSFPGRFVLMGDRAGNLVAWDLKNNDHMLTHQKFHTGPVLSVAYQPHGAGTFLSAGGDGFLKIRWPDGRRSSIHAHDGPIFQAGYSARGTFIYTLGTDRKIRIWNSKLMTSEHPNAVLEGHLKYVLAGDISSNQQILASGGGDKALNLWNIQSRELIGRMTGHTSDIEAIAFTPDNKFIISTSEDKSIRVWSVDNREELVRMFFKKDTDKFAGVTFENQIFGDRDSGLLSTYVDGHATSSIDSGGAVEYIGRGIAIVDSTN